MIRPGERGDMAELVALRTSVVENHLSVDEMATRGITPQTVMASIEAGERCCLVAEEDGVIAGFSMGDRRDGQIFALFTRPGHEGRGHGSRLLDGALDWLKACEPRNRLAAHGTGHAGGTLLSVEGLAAGRQDRRRRCHLAS